MSLNNKIQVESEFNKLTVSDNSVIINHENCYKQEYPHHKLWCKECVPRHIIEGWTSGNHDIDKFIKDTIYNTKIYGYCPLFLEWVSFDRFKDIKQIGESGFAKVYSATWIDGRAEYYRQDDKSWKKEKPEPFTVTLKRLNGSQNMSVDYLNELKLHWKLFNVETHSSKFYGMTKDPETGEFMMIIQFTDQGNLRCALSSNFNTILWKDKIKYLFGSTIDLKNLHELGYFHKDFHSGNILQNQNSDKTISSYISDFGLSGPANEQKSNDKICGVLSYIAPEVLNKEPYTLSSDIYSFGVIMAELSSGKPPFYDRKHNLRLALDICNGLRPEFGKGTPEIYKKLAHKCMNANPNQRPTVSELYDIIEFWYTSFDDNESYQENKKFGYKGKEIKAIFDEADKEIPNISILYEKIPNAIYTSRKFTFENLSKPINSFIITSLYLSDEENNKDCQDSQLVDLEVSITLQ